MLGSSSGLVGAERGAGCCDMQPAPAQETMQTPLCSLWTASQLLFRCFYIVCRLWGQSGSESGLVTRQAGPARVAAPGTAAQLHAPALRSHVNCRPGGFTGRRGSRAALGACWGRAHNSWLMLAFLPFIFLGSRAPCRTRVGVEQLRGLHAWGLAAEGAACMRACEGACGRVQCAHARTQHNNGTHKTARLTWMLGSTPPDAMVTLPSSLDSSSSLRTASCGHGSQGVGGG